MITVHNDSGIPICTSITNSATATMISGNTSGSMINPTIPDFIGNRYFAEARAAASAARRDTKHRTVKRPQTVVAEEDGALKQIEMIMGVAVISGQERVVVPFIDRGIPVEYELEICRKGLRIPESRSTM